MTPKLIHATAVIPLMFMSACVEATGGNVPEAVAALAAPNQDLSTARLREEDGCYWYEHAGPVETTLLPLRTPEGRPICTQAQS